MISLPRVQCAVHALRCGQVIAYPTEGVWGLGCDPDNAQAVEALLGMKGRSPAKGLILVASSIRQLQDWLPPLTADQRETLARSWPGPNTWLVPVSDRVPLWISGGRATLALRVSAHPVVRALCDAFGGPLVSTSANRSGRAAATSLLDVQLRFPQVLRVPGELTQPGKASTIRDLQTGSIIRP